MTSIAELVEHEVMSWPNVEKLPHRFGGIEFRVNGHEIGHLHGNRQADLPFSVPLKGVNVDLAERACKGVFIPHLKRSCVQDVMVTGNTNFGKGYVLSQGLPKYKIKVPNGKPKEIR